MFRLNLSTADGSRGSQFQGQDNIVWTKEPEAQTVSVALTITTSITMTGDQWRRLESTGRSLNEIDETMTRALTELVNVERQYAVQGRRHGQDEDDLVLISANSLDEACERFRKEIGDAGEVYITNTATGICLEVL